MSFTPKTRVRELKMHTGAPNWNRCGTKVTHTNMPQLKVDENLSTRLHGGQEQAWDDGTSPMAKGMVMLEEEIMVGIGGMVAATG